MKHLRRSRALATLLSLAMVAGLFPGTAFAAGDGTMVDTGISQPETSLLSSVSDVPYLDANGELKTAPAATSVEASSTAWEAGWYVVDSDVTISDRITVTGDVHLILKDNCTLQAQNGIEVNSEGASLTIYAQSTGENTMGSLVAIGQENGDSGIGGDIDSFQGAITINGGNINATGAFGCAGIGGISQIGDEDGPSTGTVTINGGIVTATGGEYAPGIGIGGDNYSRIFIEIHGGTIQATGGMNGGAGIGSRENGAKAYFDITITGGDVTAIGKNGGAGIGGGMNNNNGKITITGGTVIATGSDNDSGAGAGIGGGQYIESDVGQGSGIEVDISGGVIHATGGANAPGIGPGVDSQGATYPAGAFQAGGHAVIFASSIWDTSLRDSWSGVIFQGAEGKVYGSSVTLDTSFEIPSGYTLTVPGDATLTLSDGVTITNNGTIENCGVIDGTGTIGRTPANTRIALDILDENGQDTDGKIAFGQEITLRAYGPNLPTSGNVQFSWDNGSKTVAIGNGEAQFSIQIPEEEENGAWTRGKKSFTVTADAAPEITGTAKADLLWFATPQLTVDQVTTTTVTVSESFTVLGHAPEEAKPTVVYGYSRSDESMKNIIWGKQGPTFSGLNPGTSYKFYAKVQEDDNFHEMISEPLEVSTQPARTDFSDGELDLADGKVSIRSLGNGKLQVVQAGEYYEISENMVIPIAGTWSQSEDSEEIDVPISIESGVNAQIRLSDVTMTAPRGPMSRTAVSVDENSTIRLILEGSNHASGFEGGGIYLSESCSLILDGTGSLTIGSPDNYSDRAIDLSPDSKLQIEGGRLIVYARSNRLTVDGKTSVTLPISNAPVQALTLSDENGVLDGGWAMAVSNYYNENATLWLADGTYNGSILVNGQVKTIPKFTVPAQSGSSVQLENSDISVTLPDDAKLPLPVINGQFVVPGGTTVDVDGEQAKVTEDSVLNPADGQVSQYLTVAFDAQNGTTPETYNVIEGDTVAKPVTNPEKPGYVFDGWYREKDAESPFDFESAITENITLYAHWIQIQDVNLTVTATPDTLSGGGTVTLTVSGLPDGESATVTCPDVEVTGDGATFTATLPNETKAYTFTANYAGSELYTPASATCTVNVTRQNTSSGGSSSSGGGSSSSGSQSETTTNPDGSTTTIVTNPNGDRVETTQYPDGSSSVTTVDADGNKKIEVTLPEKVLADAEENQETVKLPISAVENGTDNTATITVDLPENMVAKVEIPVENVTAGTVAVVVKPDGTEEVLMDSTVSENGVVATVSDGMVVKVEDRSKAFTDMPSNHWAYGDVQFAVSHDLFNGTSGDTFSPNSSMTRAMVVTVLARYEGVDTSTGSTWYDAGRDWAMQNGVSDGTNIEASITREQLATMLYRYAGEPAVSGTITGFTDAAAVSGWAQDAMLWAIENGLISGMGDGSLNPQGNATRAQVATILARFVKWAA